LADQPERRPEGGPIPYEERLRVLCHLPVTVHPAGDFTSSHALYREIDDLRQQLFAIYNAGLSPEHREEEFWIVAHPLLRFTSHPR